MIDTGLQGQDQSQRFMPYKTYKWCLRPLTWMNSLKNEWRREESKTQPLDSFTVRGHLDEEEVWSRSSKESRWETRVCDLWEGRTVSPEETEINSVHKDKD